MVFKTISIACAMLFVSASAEAAPANATPVNMAMSPAGSFCSWGAGVYSNGARMCVSPVRLMICVNGEWRVDETRTPFTEDVCRMDNPRAPVFGK